MGELRVCVVGAGPRGLCVLERLRANAAAGLSPGRLVVHVVDPMIDRGGAVWSKGQPTELLMNTVASQVTVFTDDSVDCAGPIVPGPSLYEWGHSLATIDRSVPYPAWVRAEAARLGPDDYSSRALYGHYLTWVLRRLTEQSGPDVLVIPHRDTAVAVTDMAGGSQVVTLAGGARLAGIDVVVLAQGHVPMPLTDAEAELARFADAHGLFYLPPVNPADAALDGVGAGEPVLLRGLGLSFFDYQVMLTQGRGGRFGTESGRLVYHPSGREPVIYAGSRRGVPLHARGENQKGVFGRHQPRFLTPEVIERFRERARLGGPARFHRDVWPLISLEVQSVYYAALVADRCGPQAADRLLARFVAAAGVGGDAVAGVLADFGIAPADRWNWDRLAHPYGDRRFADHAGYRRWLMDYLRADLAQARRGNVDSPLKAAVDALRDLRNEVRQIVDHGGLTGSSYRDELQRHYTRLNAFLSIGPPAQRLAEMIALIEAGVLRVMGPQLQVRPAGDGAAFLASSAVLPDPPVPVRALVEARLPEVDIRRTDDPLICQLIASGQAVPYRIPDGFGHYEGGGLAVTQSPFHVVDARGRAHPSRFAFGVPTETVHWATAAGVRPGVNSVILGDADAIARASLRCAEPMYTAARKRVAG